MSALAKQPRRAALLTFLAVERDVARERVITLLWPEATPERGRHSLNQGIYYLRRLIGADWVELHGDRIIVAPWVLTDVQELERAAGADAQQDVLRLYGGRLLEGTGITATADFDIWVDARRAALDRLHRRARRDVLAALLAGGRTDEALRCAEEWCNLDPLEDEAQHRFIELLASTGRRTDALRQFGSYRRLLEEHELRPLDETLELIEQLQQGEAGPLPPVRGDDAAVRPAIVPPAPRPPAAALAAPAATPRLLRDRRGLLVLLGLVFLINLVETTIETLVEPHLHLIGELRLHFARGAHWFEGRYAFEHHELTNQLAVVGYSAAYFFMLPILLIAVGVACYRRPGIRPFRTFSLAVALDYALSLPFFLLMPVPERWMYPEAGAMVLSDLWVTRLIDLFRPISAVDNSFPSFHVSLTVALVLTSFAFRLRYRWSVAFLGAPIILATMVLGIHWLTDVVAGAALGVVSLMLALRVDRSLKDDKRPPAQPVQVAKPPHRVAVPALSGEDRP
jgi:DNA-binding SARP family transcriptional activator/membrane-associated phospholipid phosphatase